MKKIVEFSKSYGNIRQIKNDFYDSNTKNLKIPLKFLVIIKNNL